MLSKDTPKARRFRIWGICLLIVGLSVSIVVHLAGRPSEPFVSVSFTNPRIVSRHVFEAWPFEGLLDSKAMGIQIISLQVSNRMSFNVNYWIESQMKLSGKWAPLMGGSSPVVSSCHGSLDAHSETSVDILAPLKGTRVYVEFERELNFTEISILAKVPWLKRHYPFQHRHSITIYEGQAREVTVYAF